MEEMQDNYNFLKKKRA